MDKQLERGASFEGAWVMRIERSIGLADDSVPGIGDRIGNDGDVFVSLTC